MKKSFLEFFARLQTRDINNMSPNPFHGDDSFSYWLKKKKKKKKRKTIHCRDAHCNGTNWPGNKFTRRRFIRNGKSSVATMNLLAQIICSDLFFFFFNICYHGGGSTKHFRRPKVKRRDEESSPSDAFTPKKRKTRLAGKTRTYLWACPLTPTPQPHLPFPTFVKYTCIDPLKWQE